MIRPAEPDFEPPEFPEDDDEDGIPWDLDRGGSLGNEEDE